MYISVKKKYKLLLGLALLLLICSLFLFAKKEYQRVDFGVSFGNKSAMAITKLAEMQELFETCARLCNTDAGFMQAVVFPEVMRYSTLKDGIEAESLRTLYVQFGKEYANFSIGLFQMKPSFAEDVEQKTAALLPRNLVAELQLEYSTGNEESIRRQRIERMKDKEWQLIYLTAFIAICNETYKTKSFLSSLDKLQWYATVYNAGFNRTDNYILQKVNQENFYLQQNMPEKKFKYAAIAGWYFERGL